MLFFTCATMITTRFLTYEQLLSMMPEKETGSAKKGVRKKHNDILLAQHVYEYGYPNGLDSQFAFHDVTNWAGIFAWHVPIVDVRNGAHNIIVAGVCASCQVYCVCFWGS